MMKHVWLASILVIASNLQAALVEKDLVTLGDKLLTLDTSTGLEWLDFGPNQSKPITSILSDDGGWISAGFRIATKSEVAALWATAGISVIGDTFAAPKIYVEENFAGVNLLIDLMGQTQDPDTGIGGFRFAYAHFVIDESHYGGGQIVSHTEYPLAAANLAEHGNVDPNAIFIFRSTYLVRQANLDSDGDGILDDVDECTDTDLRPTIWIGGVDTGVENELLPTGCTLADLIDVTLEENPTTSDLVALLVQWKAEGLLTGREMGEILKAMNGR